jgi:hypothetical protein
LVVKDRAKFETSGLSYTKLCISSEVPVSFPDCNESAEFIIFVQVWMNQLLTAMLPPSPILAIHHKINALASKDDMLILKQCVLSEWITSSIGGTILYLTLTLSHYRCFEISVQCEIDPRYGEFLEPVMNYWIFKVDNNALKYVSI